MYITQYFVVIWSWYYLPGENERVSCQDTTIQENIEDGKETLSYSPSSFQYYCHLIWLTSFIEISIRKRIYL